MKLFKPKRPSYNDIKKYEGAFYGGNTDSIQENTSEDVGATPTSSTIEKQPFPAPPIRHGIRKIIEWYVVMNIIKGNKVVIKTRYANNRRARTNYPYQPEEIKKMQTEPMTVMDVSTAPDSVYIDCKTYLGRPMIQEHGHMWFLESDLNIVSNWGVT